MRSLPIPPAKSLNTAQVLQSLPFPDGEGRHSPPESQIRPKDDKKVDNFASCSFSKPEKKDSNARNESLASFSFFKTN